MTALNPSSPPLPYWRALANDRALPGRAGAYAAAAALHAGVLALLLMAPPVVLDPVRGAVNAVEVRLYTVAGGEDAQSDAPLFEPPIADAPQDGQGDLGAPPAPVVIAPDIAEDTAAQAPTEADEPSEPEIADTETEPAQTPGEPTLAADAGARAPAGTPGVAVETGAGQATEAAAAPAPGEPLATTQLAPGERRARRAGPPTFAEILARAETRLDPADFQVARLLGGVRGATQESFCLSSASGNRDAMDCPDEPNAASAELARYGLMGLGEEAPDFMEDMSRVEFQLRTLGADDNTVTRILTGLREARREAINTPPLSRQLNRDASEREIDNLGNPRMGIPMPDNPGG
ncbi:hypothetical protein ACWCOP_03035 [Maricaulaceae bacterium MS644]